MLSALVFNKQNCFNCKTQGTNVILQITLKSCCFFMFLETKMNKEPQSRIRKNKMEVVKKLERKRKVLVKQLEEANRKNKQLRKEHVKLRVRSKLLQQDQQVLIFPFLFLIFNSNCSVASLNLCFFLHRRSMVK